MCAEGATGDLCKDTANCPASAHSAYICVYVFAPASRSDAPLQAIRSLQGHPTGGPSLRDGHSQLSHRIKRIGSAREKRMENDFLVNCSTPFLVASRSDATPCQDPFTTWATLQGVRRSATDIRIYRSESKKIGSAREKRMENDFLVNCSTPFLVASRSDATPCQDSWSREAQTMTT